MSTHQLPANPTLPLLNLSAAVNERVSLVVSLTATFDIHISKEISSILNQKIDRPYPFLGSVGETLVLDLKLDDLGRVATEILARRLLKIKGVQKLTAQRQSSRRGIIYAIRLQSPVGRKRLESCQPECP